MKLRGNCYVAAEALWWVLDGPESYWQPMQLKIKGDIHWFLKHRAWGTILDPSRCQFHTLPRYHKAKRAAFLTKRPSKRAMKLITELTWQKETR